MDADLLIRRIHESSIDPDQWPETLALLSAFTGADAACLCFNPISRPTQGVHWLHELDPEGFLGAFRRHARGALQPSMRKLLGSRVGAILDKREIFTDGEPDDDLANRDLFVSQGLEHGLFCVAQKDRESFSTLILMRGVRRGGIDRRRRRALAALSPHLTTALRVYRRIQKAERRVDEMRDTLSSLSIGVLLVGPSLEIRFRNAEAERIMGLGDGIGASGGRLMLGDGNARRRLGDLVERARRRENCAADMDVIVQRPSGAEPFALRVSPVGASCGDAADGRSVAAVFFADPSLRPDPPAAALLRSRFGLTAAEAEVARLALTGISVPEVASKANVTVNTARTQLKAVYAKTGAHSRTDLLLQSFQSFHAINA